MKSDAVIITLMLSSGKTVAFDTTSRYIPAIKLAIEDSGKHDRHKLTSVFNFMSDAVGPDISVCMYNVVLMISVTMAEVQMMKQKTKSGILVPALQQKPQTIKLN